MVDNKIIILSMLAPITREIILLPY